MPTNIAAWIGAKYAQLEVGPAPYPAPGEDQIGVRNHGVAVNPLDWIIQLAGLTIYRWLSYPTVLGSDVAGEVVEVASAVTRFRVGDRVLAHAIGTDKDSNSAAEGAFQAYTVVLERLASPIPDSLSYASACVLPLAITTAACGLFQADQLALQYPSAHAQPTGRTVLVWGGSTSVGSNAIQLAVAAGYDVITTASPRNFDYVTALGASQVFDYNSPTIVADLVAAFQGRTLAGALALGTTSADASADVLPSCTGSKFIFGTSLKANDVSTAIYRDFLPDALAEGRYTAAPEPSVVGHGLAAIQHALDTQRKRVSAQKVVVTLPASSEPSLSAWGDAPAGCRRTERGWGDESLQ